jgi:uncharacterized protein
MLRWLHSCSAELFHFQIIPVVVVSTGHTKALPAARRLDTNNLENGISLELMRSLNAVTLS